MRKGCILLRSPIKEVQNAFVSRWTGTPSASASTFWVGVSPPKGILPTGDDHTHFLRASIIHTRIIDFIEDARAERKPDAAGLF
jgi:hypothetical protein